MRLLQFLSEITVRKSSDFDSSKKIYVGPRSFMVKFDSNGVRMAFRALIWRAVPKYDNSKDFLYIWEIQFGFVNGDYLEMQSNQSKHKEDHDKGKQKHRMQTLLVKQLQSGSSQLSRKALSNFS